MSRHERRFHVGAQCRAAVGFCLRRNALFDGHDLMTSSISSFDQLVQLWIVARGPRLSTGVQFLESLDLNGVVSHRG